MTGFLVWAFENYMGAENHDRVAPGALTKLAEPTSLVGYLDRYFLIHDFTEKASFDSRMYF